MGFYSWIQGGFRGKVGAHIGQKIDGKYIQKAYAVPSNPQTAKQQAQRNKFNAPNSYNKQLLAWNLFPGETGAERADANAQQISDFFKYNESLSKSLFRLRFPEYEKRELEFVDMAFAPYDNGVSFEFFYESAVDEDDQDLEFECVIRLCVFNYTKQCFLFAESSVLTPALIPYSTRYGFQWSEDINDSRFEETDTILGFCYPIIDGKSYAREFVYSSL